MGKTRRVAGCIPFRHYDPPEILLINSSKHPDSLIFPKGGVKRGESARHAAKRETFEEAGVQGSLIRRLDSNMAWINIDKGDDSDLDDPFYDDSIYCYDDDDGQPAQADQKLCRWYQMQVEEVCDEWPEMHLRRRHWILLSQAGHLPNLRKATRQLIESMQKQLL